MSLRESVLMLWFQLLLMGLLTVVSVHLVDLLRILALACHIRTLGLSDFKLRQLTQ